MAKASSRMAVNGGQDCPPTFLHDDGFFSRLLSKEKYNSSKQGGEASSRVLYYGGAAGSVPFLWESQPGTPKHTLSDNPLPPLTPPPSYQQGGQTKSPRKKHSRNSNKVFDSIFPRRPSKKINASPSLSPLQTSSPFGERKNNIKTRWRRRVSSGLGREVEEYEVGTYSPTWTLCFGARNGSPWRRPSAYSDPIKNVKKVVLSIVGHGRGN